MADSKPRPDLAAAPETAECTCGQEAGCSARAENGTPTGQRDADWSRAAWWARVLAWASLAWMCLEGGLGLYAGLVAGSIALTGWALGSVVEGLASVVVVWRFTGPRSLSEAAERRAQQWVAVSFWLIAPYVAAESIRDLLAGHQAAPSRVGLVLTAVALVVMPALGWAKRRLGARLNSGATAGEGTQNYLCAAQAAAVLLGLAVTAAWAGGWWVDPAIGLLIAAWSAREGLESWRGEDCC